jgi:hypothetical protein
MPKAADTSASSIRYLARDLQRVLGRTTPA